MSRYEGENCYLFSVSIDGSNEGQGWHTEVSSLLPQNNPTVDLTAASNYIHDE